METTQVTTQTSLTPLRIGILLLGLTTAIVHLQLAFPDFLFILNGLGYLGLLGAFFLPIPFFQERHALVRLALIAFAAITIIAWIFIGARSILGYVDKTIEVLLIILLLIDSR